MSKEDKPDVPVVKGDQITNVIGEVGRWQIEKILIVFFAAAPGKLEIYDGKLLFIPVFQRIVIFTRIRISIRIIHINQ